MLKHKKLIIAIVAVLVLLLCFALILSSNEYKPAEVETVAVNTEEGSGKKLTKDSEIKLLTWNAGHATLGDNADSYVAGVKETSETSLERMEVNLGGLRGGVSMTEPDIVLWQDIDANAKRSYNVNELDRINGGLTPLLNNEGYVSTFAYNHKTDYYPSLFNNKEGKIEGGIAVLSKYSVKDASRVSLPEKNGWYKKLSSMKPCILVNRIAVYDEDEKDTGKELVIVDVQMNNYLGGSNSAKLKKLRSFIQEEYDKGNYVIAGGDFSEDLTAMDKNYFGEDFSLHIDNENKTARALDKPYSGADKSSVSYYIEDGYVVSSNIEVEEIYTVNMMYAPSYHNPVSMTIKLK